MKDDNNLNEYGCTQECFAVKLTNPMLYDQLHVLSMEYSLSVEQLINIAVERLLADVEFVRDLRTAMNCSR